MSVLGTFSFLMIELNTWKVIGLSGSLIFGVRFLLQWIASERAGKSIIPVGFWECSLLGSLLALSYFIFYRHDSVGIIMTLLPVPIYLRNFYLKWREVLSQQRRTAPIEPKDQFREEVESR
jgi:Predicted membrane protein